MKHLTIWFRSGEKLPEEFSDIPDDEPIFIEALGAFLVVTYKNKIYFYPSGSLSFAEYEHTT